MRKMKKQQSDKKIFDKLYDHAYHFQSSRKEQTVQSAEDWSVAILSGSSSSQVIEEPVRSSFQRVLKLVVFGVATVLCLQLFSLQVVNGAHNQNLAEGNRIRRQVLSAPRGVIYDRNHTLLVENLANFDLTATPSLLSRDQAKREQLYTLIAGILGLSAEQVSKSIEAKGLQSSTPVVVADKIPRDKALALDEKSRELVGLDLNVSPSRQYLDGGNLSAFLGYIGRISPDELKRRHGYLPTDYIGKGGLENAYESELKGKSGYEQTEIEASGRPVRVLDSIDPQPGNNLVLSLDSKFQARTSQILADGVKKAGSAAGVAVAMNPQTGEILAAANYPSFDNNLFARGISNADYSRLLNDSSKPLFNRITAGLYPIGSTIKPLMASAALQEHVINQTTTIQDQGKIEVHNLYNPSIVQIFKGWKPEGLGAVNVFRAIAWSSDIFFYTIGGGYQGFRGLGINRMDSYLEKFGFGRKTGIDTGAEATGSVPSPESKLAIAHEAWNIGDSYNVSIGQGDLLVTPLQLLVATSAVANGGTIYVPHLVREVDSPDGKKIRSINPRAIVRDIIDPANLAIVRAGMVEAVASGTACCSIKTVVPVTVAGKTGTAETSTQDENGKSATKPHAWFTAFAPADNPQIAVVVLVEFSGEGAEFAVPIARDVLKAYFVPGS